MDNVRTKEPNKPASTRWLKWAVVAAVCGLLLRQDQHSRKKLSYS